MYKFYSVLLAAKVAAEQDLSNLKWSVKPCSPIDQFPVESI